MDRLGSDGCTHLRGELSFHQFTPSIFLHFFGSFVLKFTCAYCIRAMKECKGLCHNKRYIEASITNSIILNEAVRYAMEQAKARAEGGHKANWAAFLDEDSDFSDEGSILGDKEVLLSPVQWVQIRRWLIFQRCQPELDDYYRYLLLYNFCLYGH